MVYVIIENTRLQPTDLFIVPNFCKASFNVFVATSVAASLAASTPAAAPALSPASAPAIAPALAPLSLASLSPNSAPALAPALAAMFISRDWVAVWLAPSIRKKKVQK